MDGKSKGKDELQSLPAGRGQVELHYAGLSYLVPERVRFKYKLEGFDHEWVDAGTRRVAYYTNLPPGPYTLPGQGLQQRRRLERRRRIGLLHHPPPLVPELVVVRAR